MLARVREASPAVVLAGTAVCVAVLIALSTAIALAGDAPLLLVAPAVGLILALSAFAAVRAGSPTAIGLLIAIVALLLPLSLIGVSLGGFSLLPVATLVLCACVTSTAAPRLSASSRLAPVSAAVALVALTAAAAYAGGIAFSHTDDPVYGVPDWGGAAIVAVVVLALVGSGLGVLSRRPGLALSIAGGVGTIVFLGLLGALLFFPLLAIPALLFALAFTWQWTGERRTVAVIGGVALGFAAPALALGALAGPLVDCSTGESGANVWVNPPGLEDFAFGGISMSSGSSSSLSGGVVRGTSRGSDYAVRYTCDGDRLVSFSLRRF